MKNTANSKKFSSIQESSTIRILMVEDHPISQLTQKIFLEKLGYQVDIASSGEEALAMFPQNYDAIFLDVDLPGMNGFEISSTIRNQTNGQSVPIIGISACGDFFEKESLAAGYNEMLCKPVYPKELDRVLKRYLPSAKQ